MVEFNIKEEAEAIYSNIQETGKEALHGPVGLFKNPIRFMFYATMFGVTQLLVFQVINQALNKSMEDK
jgi:hypothetical protein